MSERCKCGCMDRQDRFGNYDLCPLAEEWLEQQQADALLEWVGSDSLDWDGLWEDEAA